MKTKILHKHKKTEYDLLMENKNFRNSRHYIYNKKNLKNIYRFYSFEIFIVGAPLILGIYVGMICLLTGMLFLGKIGFIISMLGIIIFLFGKEKLYKIISKNLFYTGYLNYNQIVRKSQYIGEFSYKNLENFSQKSIYDNNNSIKKLFIDKRL